MKKFIPVVLTLCLVFALCACNTDADTNTTTTAAGTATTATETVADTTVAETATQADTEASAFTEDDALELVKNSCELSADDLYYQYRGIYEIDGTSYYAVDLRKSLEDSTTYLSSYFVTLDGAEIKEGYITGEVASISDTKPTIDVTEDNAVKVVEAAYDFEDGCFLTYKGVEEIDGVKYFAVDLRKSLESNTTYLSSFFVTETGTIVMGYYEGGTAVLAE
ncbi:MAG: hypothetical protein IJ298_01450 [Ruminococcus sp.]|nr:hypothetical protein [Ruminococcus sp.]